MENFKQRKDRFDFFESFEKPLLNLTFRLEVPDFLTFCKINNLPPFHFFLFHLFQSLHELDNFKFRIFENNVIKIDKIIGSYTVLSADNLFNYTCFEYSPDLMEFIKRSLEAKAEAMNSKKLLYTGNELSPREMKNYIFITSLPWLDFTSIEHPVYKAKSADIPAIAWGKFKTENDGISMPFSVQAHHGFVDGIHIHQLAEKIKSNIQKTLLAN